MLQDADAAADYRQAAGIDPKAYYMFRALSHYKKGKYSGAVSDCTVGISVDPKNPVLFKLRADAYRALGDEEKAAADEKTADSLAKAADGMKNRDAK